MTDPSLLSIPGLHDAAEQRQRDWFEAYSPGRWERHPMKRRAIAVDERLLCDLDRAESRDFWLRWLAAGSRCGVCDGVGIAPPTAPLACTLCAGTGWLRPAHDGGWMRDGWKLSPEQSAACIAWSVRSVAAGGSPLRGMLGPWNLRWRRKGIAGNVPAGSHGVLECNDHYGWTLNTLGVTYLGRGEKTGPETGDDGNRAADAAALSIGYGLLDDAGGLTLPDLPVAIATEPRSPA